MAVKNNSLAVVLTDDTEPTDAVTLAVALHDQGFDAAAKRLEDGSTAFDLGSGAEMVAVHVPVPHPEASTMRRDAASPLPEEIAAARAHILVAALHLDRLVGTQNEDIDMAMLRVASAVTTTTDAVAVMLGHGIYFHRPEVFLGMTVVNAEWNRLPPSIVVNVTAGQDESGRLTLLSHGLARYGRTELLVGCTADREASREFIDSMIGWLLASRDHRLEPGHSVPSATGGLVVVEARPSPLGDGSPVAYIELGGS